MNPCIRRQGGKARVFRKPMGDRRPRQHGQPPVHADRQQGGLPMIRHGEHDAIDRPARNHALEVRVDRGPQHSHRPELGREVAGPMAVRIDRGDNPRLA